MMVMALDRAMKNQGDIHVVFGLRLKKCGMPQKNKKTLPLSRMSGILRAGSGVL